MVNKRFKTVQIGVVVTGGSVKSVGLSRGIMQYSTLYEVVPGFFCGFGIVEQVLVARGDRAGFHKHVQIHNSRPEVLIKQDILKPSVIAVGPRTFPRIPRPSGRSSPTSLAH